VRPEFWIVSSENGGLYISRDQGANWSRIENPSSATHSDNFPILEADPAANRIYAGSANESLYMIQLASPLAVAARVSAGH
jgi:hypothetical protein